jgi:carbon-monoxide dehydrogenase medium subunit
VKPAPFEYAAPLTIDEAVGALASSEEARVLAGGQSLVPLMNLRLARPQLLVDCNGVGELDSFSVNGDTVRFGAFCRHRRIELDPEIGDAAPLLAEAASLVGYPQIRNRATFGGSLAHGDPASELAAACLALGARVNLRSMSGERMVPIEEFFQSFFTTAVQAGELLVSVEVPARRPGAGYAFREYAPRHGDFALAGVAAIVERGGDGNVASVRLAGCGIGSTVIDLSDAATALVGHGLDDVRLREVATRVGELTDPPDDVHASAAYRAELAQLMAVEALRAAWARSSERQAA